MKRTETSQEIRKMRFEELYDDWKGGKLTQEEAALALGVSSRTFRRYRSRYEEDGWEGLLDKRITQASFRRAPVDEVIGVAERYTRGCLGWTVKHFYSMYKQEGGRRSYTWVKNTLQSKGLVARAPRKGVHRKRRQCSPLPGMMLFQDGSTHEWVPGKKWDLINTMDDATNEHYSLFFVVQEGTQSSFRGVKEVIEKFGLFCSLYTDRGSHYWNTPEAGGKVSKTQLTQFGRAMNQLGIQMIPSYSPQARGRIERSFKTHQDRLPRELALHGITTIEEANRYIAEHYLPAFNAEFMRPALEEGTAFLSWCGKDIDDILCEHHQRVVGKDNCVSFEGQTLQIPPDQYRCHYVKATVRIHRYIDGSKAIFYGPRKLAEYDSQGKLKTVTNEKAA